MDVVWPSAEDALCASTHTAVRLEGFTHSLPGVSRDPSLRRSRRKGVWTETSGCPDELSSLKKMDETNVTKNMKEICSKILAESAIVTKALGLC